MRNIIHRSYFLICIILFYIFTFITIRPLVKINECDVFIKYNIRQLKKKKKKTIIDFFHATNVDGDGYHIILKCLHKLFLDFSFQDVIVSHRSGLVIVVYEYSVLIHKLHP